MWKLKKLPKKKNNCTSRFCNFGQNPLVDVLERQQITAHDFIQLHVKRRGKNWEKEYFLPTYFIS